MKRLPSVCAGGSHRRMTPPTPGSVLRQLRLKSRLSQTDVARWYSVRGATVARISQIESACRTSKVVENAFRAAVDVAVLFRNRCAKLIP
jgi:hypothetical protein